MSQAVLREWEKAEIVRSTFEATHTRPGSLVTSEKNVRRYLDPPADTPYPLEYAFHLLGDVRGKAVVDFGCGSGMNSLMLAHRGARVYAFDISESLVRIAAERLAANGLAHAVRFMVCSAHDLPLPDGSVDVVFGAAILHHLDLDLASRETHRVLRAGGRAIFQEPVRNSRVMRVARRLIPYRAPDVSPFERPLTDTELSGFGRRFRRMRSRAFSLPHVRLAHVLPVSEDRRRAAYRSDRRALDRFPFLQTYAAIRVIELQK